MNNSTFPAALACALLISHVAPANDLDEFGRRASWQVPAAEQVAADVRAWLADQAVDEAIRAEVMAEWSDDDNEAESDLLLRFATSVARVDPRAADLVEHCRSASPTSPPDVAWLQDENVAPLVRHNLRLLLAQTLIDQALYDEAAGYLADLEPADVVDPAGLLFYQGVVHHRLLDRAACLERLTTLLEQEALIPRRYAAVARLMRADIKPLETDSLDEVSRLMEDIERRLRLARAGTRVRKQEDDVVAKLDKMIEQLEQQQQQQQQQQSSSGQGSSQSGKPAEDSRPLGGSGPGDVDQKERENQSDWGNLPPKERQEALQQISKDLPPHYREVVEEYFRKLAGETGSE